MSTVTVRSHASDSHGAYAIVLGGFLVLNVVLGGAIFEAPIFDLVLQLAGCGILCWCILDQTPSRIGRAQVFLLTLAATTFVVCISQLVPLPIAWWKALPGREEPARVIELVQLREAMLPISLAPQETFEAILWLLPPAAILALIVKLGVKGAVTAGRWTIPSLAAAGALLGIAQVAAADQFSLYLHEGPSRGHAAGFFQVVNYQPTLLLMAVPFLAVLFSRLGAQFETGDRYLAQGVLLGAAALLLVVGVAAAGSVAGYVLLIPVVVASLPIALHRGMRLGVFAAVLVAIGALVGAAFYVAGSPLLASVGSTDLGTGPTSRLGSLEISTRMAGDYFPAGAGVGAFRDAYGAYEDPALVRHTFLEHAHNDYLETVVELGLPGLLLLGGILVWWLVVTIMVWRRPMEEGLRSRRAASVAVGVVIVHSLVDSPARTEAIACLAVFCLGLMSSAPNRRPTNPEGVISHRHINL